MSAPNLRTRLTAAGALCLCAFLLALVWHRNNLEAGAGTPAPILEKGMNICAGRVVFSVPQGSNVVGRDVRLDDLKLEWRPLPPGGLAVLRTETIEELQGRVLFKDGEHSHESGPFKEFRFDSAWGAFYYDVPGFKEVIEMRAFRPLKERVLVIAGGGSPDTEASIASSVQQMSSTLREHVAGATVSENAPYCLDGAVVSFPFQGIREKTGVTTTLPQGHILDVDIESNGKRLQPSLDAMKEQMITRFADEGIEAVIEHNRRLDSRAYEGDELVIHATTTTERIYMWRHIGKQDSATQPLIEVQLTAKLDDVTDDLDHVWAAIVHSIAPVTP